MLKILRPKKIFESKKFKNFFLRSFKKPTQNPRFFWVKRLKPALIFFKHVSLKDTYNCYGSGEFISQICTAKED